MDSHYLAFLENRKRAGTASLENLHRRDFVEEGRTSILLTIAKDRTFEELKNINLCGCKVITKLPSLLCAPNLKNLDMSGCENLIEIDKSVGDLDKLETWNLRNCSKLKILPSGPNRNKLQLLEEIDIPTANSFDGFSRYRFLSLTQLWLHSWDGDITELDFQYFPLLSYLTICDSTIISIPQSISGFARLESIHIENCKRLREIPTLPQSVREVFVKECPSVDPQSFSRLLIQFGEILGILRNRFHEGARSNISMDPFHDSESESEDEYKIYGVLRLPVTEIPKDLKFSHQTFGNSVSFWVGKNFSKAVICIALGTLEAHMSSDYSVNISINGCVQQCLYKGWSEEKLWLFPIYLGQLDKLSEQNHIIVEGEYWIENPNEGSSIFELEYGTDLIKWIGVNVECSCYPKNSDVPCLPRPCAMNECGAAVTMDNTYVQVIKHFPTT
ncbi:disease resistance protein rml1b [Quercus suber]|uniref:Disease resistance protein rml1b n=1 Tax=Quercus suber TaxID=58331 RepID=A0AAW0KRB7_QUESU